MSEEENQGFSEFFKKEDCSHSEYVERTANILLKVFEERVRKGLLAKSKEMSKEFYIDKS